MPWVNAFSTDEIEPDDVKRFDYDGKTYAIYRTEDDEFYCSDGLCTHEQVHLADGLLVGLEIECPKHNGRFDVRTGEARCRPATLRLQTYPARQEDGRVWVDLPSASG